MTPGTVMAKDKETFDTDVVVVGAGPNGLAAAATLARAGLRVLVLERNATPGGGARTEALTVPGFLHDTCSTAHPLGRASPVFRALDLERHGLTWIEPAAPVAHVMDEDTVVTLERSVDETAAGLTRDGAAYARLMGPFARRFADLMDMFLGPLRVPAAPALFVRFGLQALRSMRGLARARFRDARAPALLAGIAAHAMLPLDAAATASFALILGSAGHAVSWPLARGGSRAITDALLACLRQHGGEVHCNTTIDHLETLPRARAYLLDVTPRQFLRLAGSALPAIYRARLRRFRYGPGVFKMDWALRTPIPWRDPRCARAATVHLAGTLADVATSEAAVHAGHVADRPFVLLVQPSLFDDQRAPPGMHVAWAYCHVPNGSSLDVSARIEAQIERFAPGFAASIVARTTRNTAQMEQHNPNYVGGDINGGLADFGQLLFRPVARVDPYATPLPRVFLCSSATPPGGGVHGMCGYWAAQSALRRVFGRRSTAARRT
jgi:phytoene dehydrogenase-like protein